MVVGAVGAAAAISELCSLIPHFALKVACKALIAGIGSPMNQLVQRMIVAGATAAVLLAMLTLVVDIEGSVPLALAVVGSLATGSAAAVLSVRGQKRKHDSGTAGSDTA